MAQPQEPAQGIHLGVAQTGPGLGRLAPCTTPQRPKPLSKSGGMLNDRARSRMLGKPLVRFCEGLECNSGDGGNIVAPPRKQAANSEHQPPPVVRAVSSLLERLSWRNPVEFSTPRTSAAHVRFCFEVPQGTRLGSDALRPQLAKRAHSTIPSGPPVGQVRLPWLAVGHQQSVSGDRRLSDVPYRRSALVA